MGKKIDSLIRLAGWGFNTPEFEIVKPEDGVHQFEKQFMAWEKVSIRFDSMSKNLFSLPFHPNVPWQKALEIIDAELKQSPQLVALVYKGIDPNDSLAAGKYLHWGGQELFELIMGPGTVRDLDDQKREKIRIDLGPAIISWPVDKTPILLIPYCTVLQRLRINCKDRIPGDYVLEWSIYPYKLGKKSERLVCWEVIHG